MFLHHNNGHDRKRMRKYSKEIPHSPNLTCMWNESARGLSPLLILQHVCPFLLKDDTGAAKIIGTKLSRKLEWVNNHKIEHSKKSMGVRGTVRSVS